MSVDRTMPVMTLTLVDLPKDVDAALRRRAERLRLPVDQVAVEALKAGLLTELAQTSGAGQKNLADSISARFAALGGFDLPERVQDPVREPPDFEK